MLSSVQSEGRMTQGRLGDQKLSNSVSAMRSHSEALYYGLCHLGQAVIL